MKKIATIALNMFLIVACSIVCADIVRTFVVRRNAQTRQPPARGPVAGTLFMLPGADWSRSPNGTLVFGISTACHFCTQSAPFYQRLLTSVGSGLTVIALAPEPVEKTRQYLSNLGVSIADVRQLTLSEAGIRGTPTLAYVNQKGLIERVWVGTMPPDKEKELIDFASKMARRG